MDKKLEDLLKRAANEPVDFGSIDEDEAPSDPHPATREVVAEPLIDFWPSGLEEAAIARFEQLLAQNTPLRALITGGRVALEGPQELRLSVAPAMSSLIRRGDRMDRLRALLREAFGPGWVLLAPRA